MCSTFYIGSLGEVSLYLFINSLIGSIKSNRLSVLDHFFSLTSLSKYSLEIHEGKPSDPADLKCHTSVMIFSDLHLMKSLWWGMTDAWDPGYTMSSMAFRTDCLQWRKCMDWEKGVETAEGAEGTLPLRLLFNSVFMWQKKCWDENEVGLSSSIFFYI